MGGVGSDEPIGRVGPSAVDSRGEGREEEEEL